MLSDWLANGWENAGMGFPGLPPGAGSLPTLCALRHVGSSSGTQVPHLAWMGLKGLPNGRPSLTAGSIWEGHMGQGC